MLGKKFFPRTAQPSKFKAKYCSKQSFTIAENVKIKDGKILVPKVGWLRLRRKGGNPYPDGVSVQATIKKIGKQWRVSVLYKITTPETNQNGVIIGIDLNTYNVAWTDSNGERGMLEIEKPSIKEIRIRRYQRKLARQQKGSNRRKETKRRIARLKQKQANPRKNRAHHTSRALANRAQVLVREDLNITGMSSSAKGTIEMLGKNVRAKSGLNRVILNASWARFNNYCDYKFTEVVTVAPKYTSQCCNQCGHVDKRNRLSQSKFECVSCGHTDHADYNASANVLASGIGATGRREAFPLGTSMTRQMDTAMSYGHSRI